MRINVCFPFVGDSIGGSHISSLNLIKMLQKKGHHVKVILHKKGRHSVFLEKNQIKFDYLRIDKLSGQNSNILSVVYFLIKNFFTIRNYIKKNNFDIIHGNDLRINLNWSFASKGLCKYIWHQRNYLRVKSLLFLPMFFFSTFVIVISKSVYENFPIRLKKKTKIIYNPIEKIKFKKKSRKTINIAFLGKPSFLKGFDVFLKICTTLRNKKNLKFNVYGLNFKKKKNFFRFYSFCNLNKILSDNDILIAPSRREGFGRSVVEFALAGKKVIASNIRAHREINKKFIKIILVENIFQNYINEIISNVKEKKKIYQNRLSILKPENHYKQTIKLYKSLLK